MKLLHIITSLRAGGAERLEVDLLPRLRDMGHNVDLLLFDGTQTVYYDELKQKGITIYALGYGAGVMHNPLLVFRLRSFLKRHKYDIIHTHNTSCQLLTAMAAPKAMLVTTEHNTTNHRRKWGWYKSIDSWMYGKYSHIICVSKGVECNLRKQLRNKQLIEISTIPNGIDLDKFMAATPNSEIQERYKGKHIIIMVAAFRRQKDQQTVIRAMKLLSDNYILLLVGDGKCRKECEDLVRKLNVENRVNFLGFRTDVSSLIAATDIMVMSSHYEGFCLAVVEGMAMKRPVVASNVEVLSEMVGDDAGILFPHKDYHRLSELIRQLCEDNELYKQVAENCNQYAMQFDINSMAKGYEQIYKSILKYEIN